MKYSFLKVLLGLKVVKFDTKMYLNFSNFRGRTSARVGTSLGPKTGTSVGWGGLTKIFLRTVTGELTEAQCYEPTKNSS